MIYLMSKPRFVYCFTKKLSTELDKYKISLKVFSDSVKYLSKNYNYKIYTDLDTYKDIKSFGENINIVDTESIFFTDDFKVSILDSLADNEVYIDPDVFIYSKLNINYNSDLIFCHRDTPSAWWYQDYIESIKGSLLYDKIRNWEDKIKINEAEQIPFVPNIGFLKINNSNLRRNYIDQYNLYREDLLTRPINNRNGISILLGQYLLGILFNEGKYSYFNHRDNNTKENYIHLAGPQKFELYK